MAKRKLAYSVISVLIVVAIIISVFPFNTFSYPAFTTANHTTITLGTGPLNGSSTLSLKNQVSTGFVNETDGGVSELKVSLSQVQVRMMGGNISLFFDLSVNGNIQSNLRVSHLFLNFSSFNGTNSSGSNVLDLSSDAPPGLNPNSSNLSGGGLRFANLTKDSQEFTMQNRPTWVILEGYNVSHYHFDYTSTLVFLILDKFSGSHKVMITAFLPLRGGSVSTSVEVLLNNM